MSSSPHLLVALGSWFVGFRSWCVSQQPVQLLEEGVGVQLACVVCPFVVQAVKGDLTELTHEDVIVCLILKTAVEKCVQFFQIIS